jgi:hypothetical protein
MACRSLGFDPATLRAILYYTMHTGYKTQLFGAELLDSLSTIMVKQRRSLKSSLNVIILSFQAVTVPSG